MGRWIAALLVLMACGDDDLNTGNDPSTVDDCPCRLATRFSNLSICTSPSTAFSPAHVYSTSWDGSAPSCEPWRDPQPVPAMPWSTLEVSSACTGSGQLCVDLLAGQSNRPTAEDCPLAHYCADIRYDVANQILALPTLPAWSTQSSVCANRFEQLGGYFRFDVQSEQLGCEDASPTRVPVCPPRCQTDSKGQGCDTCGTGAVVATF